jgi:3-hydroxyisobutyrate dehydrogenase-like beta-hydroxyacid dehydrogenase
MENDRIGFIGLGSMGAPIAQRFVSAGYELIVCDPLPARVEPLKAAGARVANTAREVADAAELVFSCLPSPLIGREVALGLDGVIHGNTVQVYVELSTIGSKLATEIAGTLAPRIGFVDSPVSGGPPGARAGTLSTMASGAPSHFDRVLPALYIMAKHVFYVGDKPGQAQLAKLINNHLSTAGRLATFEGLVLALKGGLDIRDLIEVINVSSGRNYTTTDKVPAAILSGSFKFNVRLAISIKDETLLQEEAAALGAPLWVAPRLLETLQEAAAGGYLERDSMLLLQYMGEQAGIDVRALLARQDDEE